MTILNYKEKSYFNLEFFKIYKYMKVNFNVSRSIFILCSEECISFTVDSYIFILLFFFICKFSPKITAPIIKYKPFFKIIMDQDSTLNKTFF